MTSLCQHGQTACPQESRVKTRRGRHTVWWRSPEWIAFRDAHARVPGAVCAHCGYYHLEQRRDRQGNPRIYKTGKHKGQPILVRLTINHRDRESYRTLEDYLKWTKDTEVCCDWCNRKWEKGEIICPVCKVNYIHWSADPAMCRECREDLDPALKAARLEKEARQEEIDRKYRNIRNQGRKHKANPHPCSRHGQLQRCLRKPGAICEHNRVNAPKKCNYFKARKVEA